MTPEEAAKLLRLLTLYCDTYEAFPQDMPYTIDGIARWCRKKIEDDRGDLTAMQRNDFNVVLMTREESQRREEQS